MLQFRANRVSKQFSCLQVLPDADLHGLCDRACCVFTALHERNSELYISEQLYGQAIDQAQEPIQTLALMNRGALRMRANDLKGALSDFSAVHANMFLAECDL